MKLEIGKYYLPRNQPSIKCYEVYMQYESASPIGLFGVRAINKDGSTGDIGVRNDDGTMATNQFNDWDLISEYTGDFK